MNAAVDRTPFHAEYVKSKCDERMRDEVRLMKRFMKGIGTYGAEPDVRGFSGYLCELITIKYGGFREAVEAASKWKIGTVLWIEKKGERFKAPLVFYDPVDSKRNVASAVHEDTLSEFITACKCYADNPDRKFFFPNKRTAPTRAKLSEIWTKRGTGLVSVSMDRPDIIIENMHAQVWKSQYSLESVLAHHGFSVLRAVHCEDEKQVHIILELEVYSLPKLYLHDGPPVHVESARKYLETWKDNVYGPPFIRDGKWNVVCERTYKDAAAVLKGEMHHAGIGKSFDLSTASVFSQDEVIERMDPSAMIELFDPRFPWEN